MKWNKNLLIQTTFSKLLLLSNHTLYAWRTCGAFSSCMKLFEDHTLIRTSNKRCQSFLVATMTCGWLVDAFPSSSDLRCDLQSTASWSDSNHGLRGGAIGTTLCQVGLDNRIEIEGWWSIEGIKYPADVLFDKEWTSLMTKHIVWEWGSIRDEGMTQDISCTISLLWIHV